MEREDRRRLRAIADEVAGWARHADGIRKDRAQAQSAASGAVQALRRTIVDVARDDSAGWRVLALGTADGNRLDAVARHANLPALAADDDQVLTHLTTDAATATRDVRSLVGVRRLVSSRKRRRAGRSAADFLWTFHGSAVATDMSGLLARLDSIGDSSSGSSLSDALVGLPRWLDLASQNPEVATEPLIAELRDALASIGPALKMEAKARAAAVGAGNEIRRAETRSILADMPVERLKDATRNRIRVAPLEDVGMRTVLDVLENKGSLDRLPGIGATTAKRIRGAARTLWQTTYEEMPTRIDVKARGAQTTELLRRLSAWDRLRRAMGRPDDVVRAQELLPLARLLGPHVSNLAVFAAGRHPAAGFKNEVDAAIRLAHSVSGAIDTPEPSNPWDDFLARPADYFTLLAELGFISEDEHKAHGDLPEDVVEAVRTFELNSTHLSVSLRGYQAFGARFALVQRKVIIGDEMGLGKTVEALAVLAHLRATGVHHSLVICPAAVVTNWVREVSSKATLPAHRVHGPGRAPAAQNWIRNGGVAVTTFETLAWFEDLTHTVSDLGCVIVDEAHYVKNPEALRSQRTRRLLKTTDYAILLTGTPLENRIEEFRNLVGYLREDLVVNASELAPRRFRKQVAPAYLRRNQEDVLTELPPLVEVNEWLPLSAADGHAYRAAVSTGNFMAMRQAAMSGGRSSEKMRRLIEIVQEAEDNGRRVVVFSYFRDVLERIARTMPGEVFGPLTGSVQGNERQAMVDRFSTAGHGAVLVSQIAAGGVGLNIQAASVVVICEPQLKPTAEWQAIARAQRMGQVESVQVHRLLSEDGVDQRITEILARKRALFDDFARTSETADTAPEAIDVSEAELTREVIAAERERLLSTQHTSTACDAADPPASPFRQL